ncbi:30S ribosomal protein S8 [Candidatus Vidania fulgoroideorum]
MKKFIISNYINSIKNCILKKKKICLVPCTKQTKNITLLLLKKYYLNKFYKKDNLLILMLAKNQKGFLISDIKLISKPSLRIYVKKKNININGIYNKKYDDIFFSCNLGILSLSDIVKKKIGGEPLFYITKNV